MGISRNQKERHARNDAGHTEKHLPHDIFLSHRQFVSFLFYVLR